HPSDTGEPGGRETGQKMSHYIEEGGAFEAVCAAYLAKNPTILYHDRVRDQAARKKKNESKTPPICPSCERTAWSAKDFDLICKACGVDLEIKDQPHQGPLPRLAPLDPGPEPEPEPAPDPEPEPDHEVTCWRRLGIKPSATVKEIKAAYRLE